MKNLLTVLIAGILSASFSNAQTSAQYLSNSDNFCSSSGTFQGNWKLTGPICLTTQNMGRIDPVWVDPDNENHIYAGSLSGGLFEKTTSGDWICLTNKLPGVGVHDVDVYKNGGQTTIVISTVTDDKRYSYGHGIYESTDGGTTWTFDEEYIEAAGTQLGIVNRTRFLHGTDGLISICNHKVLKKSSLSDPNSHWTVLPVTGMGADIDLFDLEMSPTNANIFWVAGNNGPSGTGIGLFYTSDGGTNFTDLTLTLTSPTFINIAVPVNDDAFAYYFTGTTAWINHYHWNGSTYQLQPNPTQPGQRGNWFAVSPLGNLDTMYFGTSATNAFYYSYSGGDTLSSAVNTLHADVRYISVYSTNGHVYVGDDGGVSKSASHGNSNTWIDLNASGLNVTEFYGLSGVEEQPNLIFGGAQDNYVWRFENGVPSFVQTGWDGYKTESYQDASGNVQVFYQYGPGKYPSNMERKQDGGSSPVGILPNRDSFWGGTYTGPDQHSRPIYKYPNGKFYVGQNDLYFSSNNGGNGYPIDAGDYTAAGLSGQPPFNNNVDHVNAFTVSPLDENRIYVAFGGAGDYGGSDHFRFQLYFNDPQNGWQNRTPGWPTACSSCSTCNAYATCGASITGVVSDPNNYNRVWICFNNFDYDADRTLSDQKKTGVKFSDDAGVTWHDMNTNLPNFPINCITYQKGTDDILYIGTDAGVFRWVHASGQSAWVGYWECFNVGLDPTRRMPSCMVRDININYCAGKIRVATLGRGIWESDLYPQTLVAPRTQNSATWSSNRKEIQSFTIPNGQTLTINNGAVINMAANTFIKIQTGGKLVIDNATIKNDCGYMWSGIQVLGTGSSQTQTPNSKQGVLVMKNGAKIENAYVAAMADQATYTAPDYTYPNGSATGNSQTDKTGGIIQVQFNQSKPDTISNCRKGIGFGYYHSPPVSGSEPANKSYIYGCVFQNTGTLNLPYVNAYTSEFISMWQVHGVGLAGNKFYGPTGINQSAAPLTAVVSTDADYTIGDYCISGDLPCTNVQHTEFHDLFRGVKSTITDPTEAARLLKVSNCIFSNVRRSVYLAGHKNATLTFNTINLNQATVDTAYGIYTNACTFYTIEENTITGVGTSWPNHYGMIINNSVGPNNVNDDNLVYKNTFNDLKYGAVSMRRNADCATGCTHGLEFRCNTFNNVKFSIAVFPENPSGSGQPTIKQSQGSSTDPVGNYFNISTTQYSLFKSIGFPDITYFHHSSDHYNPLSPVTLYSHFVLQNTNMAADGNTCPSHFGGGGGGNLKVEAFSPDDAKAEIAALDFSLDSLQAFIDGGNTAALVDEAKNATVTSAQLKTDLLAVGPYLSDTVLNASLQRDQPMTNSDAKAVILTNSPVTDTVFAVLEEEKPAVADNVVVQNAQDGLSARADLESEMGNLNLEKYLTLRDLKNYYEENDSVESYYSYLLEKDMNQEAIPYAFALGDSLKVQELVDGISTATTEGSNLKQYYQMTLDKMNSGESMMNLSDDEQAFVTSIANEESYSGILASNLNAFLNDTWYYEEIPIIDESKLKNEDNENVINKTIPSNPDIYPNPAFDEIFIVIPNDYLGSEMSVRIYDVYGKEMFRQEVGHSGIEIPIHIHSLPTGIYFCELCADGDVIRNDKLLVVDE